MADQVKVEIADLTISIEQMLKQVRSIEVHLMDKAKSMSSIIGSLGGYNAKKIAELFNDPAFQKSYDEVKELSSEYIRLSNEIKQKSDRKNRLISGLSQ